MTQASTIHVAGVPEGGLGWGDDDDGGGGGGGGGGGR